jgi:hypothetical protein
VQRHFPESFDPVSFDYTSKKWDGSLTGSSPPHKQHYDTSHHFTRISQKILNAASQAGTQPIHLTCVLLDLETSLDMANPVILLPKCINIPQSWPETAMVMGAQPKTKRKKHTQVDPYSGGEQSGKKAKPDV